MSSGAAIEPRPVVKAMANAEHNTTADDDFGIK
jgi:hypothetical protein